MGIEYIRDSRGKMLATVYNSGTQTYLRDFKSGRTLATYRDGKTQHLKTNSMVRGNQLMRYVRG